MISKTIQYYHDLIHVLVVKEFRIRYKSTFLGYIWSILQPLAFALVFYAVFKVVLRIPMRNFGLYLIAGLFPWQWFSNSVLASNQFFVGNSTLIKKVRFPRSFLVVAGVLNDLIHFVISVPVILVFMFWHHRYPTLSWVWLLPLLVAIQFLFTYGLSLLVATCNLFFRDLERLMTIFTLLWFYLTPIFYPIDMVPARFRDAYLYGNPMASLVACWRSIFLSLPPSSMLETEDIKDPASLVAKLRDPRDPVSRHLRERLTHVSRGDASRPNAVVQAEASRLLDAGAPADEVLGPLIEDLNWLSQNSYWTIYEPQAYRDVGLPKRIQKLLAEQPIGFDLVYVNRRILEFVYPDEIARTPTFSYTACLVALGWAVLAWLIGRRVYKAMEWRFAESV